MSRRLHALYSRTELVKLWFSSRFTSLGKILLLIMVLSFFFGLNTRATMIHQIFAVSFSVLLFSFIMTLRFTPALQITRLLPDSCVAGEVLRYRIQIENTSVKKVHSIQYQENIPLCLPDWQEYSHSREEGEEKRNAFDRKMGYYRWLWLVRVGRRVHCDAQQLPAVHPGQRKEWEILLQPLSRGSVSLQGYKLIRVDPLGLCKKEVRGGDIEKILVLPKLYSVPRFRFQGARKYHQGGITMAQERGDSTEFLSLREYVSGDPVKHIDWKSTARSGKTNVKQYRDEYFSRYGLVLDSFTSQSYSEIFEEAVSVAASIMMTQDNVNNVLDLLFVGSECLICTMGSGIASQQRMMEILASVRPCRNRPFGEMASLVRSHALLLSGVVLVFIDLDDARESVIRYLASRKIPMRVVLLAQSKGNFSEERLNSLGVPVHVVECRQVEAQMSQI